MDPKSMSAFHRLMASVVFLALWAMLVSRAAYSAESPAVGMNTDIEYSNVDGVSLTLDAYVPEGKGPFPACILVHGGAYTTGDKTKYIDPLFEPLCDAGYAWFSINYRLAPTHRWPACADDVEAAILWVKEHAAEYKVDPHRIVLIGESSGGHLVSYVGTRARGRTSVAAVVAFYAPHDLEFQVRQRQALGDSMTALFGVTHLNRETYEQLRNASASKHVEPQMPPYLLIHGDKDKGVPYEQSLRFQRKMVNLGNSCDLLVIPGGNHGMAGWETLNSDYKEKLIGWLKQTLEKEEGLTDVERFERMGAKVLVVHDVIVRIELFNSANLGMEEFGMIGSQTSLKWLTLHGNCRGLTDKSLALLSDLHKIEEMSTDGIQVTDEGLAQFTNFKKAKLLMFFHTSLGMRGFDGRGFAALKELPQLTRLTIGGSPFNDRGMEAVAEIKQIEDFRTGHTYQTQAGNQWLTKMPNLKALWLGQRLPKNNGGPNPVSLNDATFDVLTQLTKLEKLTLEEARLSLDSLCRLRELPELKKLVLRFVEVPDMDLKKLKAALPGVEIEAKPMTNEELTKLRGLLKEN